MRLRSFLPRRRAVAARIIAPRTRLAAGATPMRAAAPGSAPQERAVPERLVVPPALVDPQGLAVPRQPTVPPELSLLTAPPRLASVSERAKTPRIATRCARQRSRSASLVAARSAIPAKGSRSKASRPGFNAALWRAQRLPERAATVGFTGPETTSWSSVAVAPKAFSPPTILGRGSLHSTARVAARQYGKQDVVAGRSAVGGARRTDVCVRSELNRARVLPAVHLLYTVQITIVTAALPWVLHAVAPT